eukprot:Tbor_TRINITY_DN3205_c0_g1::TRINITY_DN3205_c0_g1_i1::g.23794::m.23794/K12198/CHMP5, VPS60; charged multivesicular body protein 5
MQRLFGRAKPESNTPKPTLEDANKRIESRVNSVEEKCRKIDEELIKIRAQIQKSRGPTQERFKQRAMQLLQQKRMYEGQRCQMQQQQFNMEQMQFTTESMQDTKLQLEVMRGASLQLKKEFKNFSIEQVEAMHDELRDLYEDAQEIQEIMGRDYELNEPIDDMELKDELDALAFDMEKEKDASYLDDALAIPSAVKTKFPDLGGMGITTPLQPVVASATATDPESLEAQLGL